MKTITSPGPWRDVTGTQCGDREVVRLAVGFAPEDFNAVKEWARGEGIPMATAVRQLALASLRGRTL